jgi:hypothetical protein
VISDTRIIASPYVQRYPRQHGARKVEANALVIKREAARALCCSAILKYIPEGASAEHEARLAEAREELRLTLLQRLALQDPDTRRQRVVVGIDRAPQQVGGRALLGIGELKRHPRI